MNFCSYRKKTNGEIEKELYIMILLSSISEMYKKQNSVNTSMGQKRNKLSHVFNKIIYIVKYI